MPPHKLEQIIGEQSKEKEFLLKMIGIPCRERESENRSHNSIQALTRNRLSQNGLHTLVYCISPACYCFVANIVLQNILIKQHRDDVCRKNEEFGYYQVR